MMFSAHVAEIALVSLVLVGLPSSARGADHRVQPGQSIQTAIQAAVNGDRVLVEPGIYHETIDFLGKAIEVLGVAGPQGTILDGGGQPVEVVRFQTAETATSILRGVTVRHGRTGLWMPSGAKPTIRNCVIESHATFGSTASSAGDGVFGGGPLLVECVIRNNEGSGIHGAAHAVRCTISGNLQSGVRFPGSLVECRIVGNTGELGGGISASFGLLMMTDCYVANNVAELGGGIGGGGVETIYVSNCTIVDNQATVSGGGLWLDGSTFADPWAFADVKVWNCVIAGNSAPIAGGLRLRAFSPNSDDVVHLTRCTIAENVPDGAHLAAESVNVSHCIYWQQLQPLVVADPLAVSYTNGSPIAGLGNFNGHPLFVSPVDRDYHLRHGSSSIDAGQPGFGDDFEGDLEQGGLADVGADEFAPRAYVGGDFAPGGAVTLRVVGVPGSPVLLLLSSSRLDSAIATPYGPLGLVFPLLLGGPIDLGTIPANSHIDLPATLPLTVPIATTIHFQAFIGGTTPQLTPIETLLVG